MRELLHYNPETGIFTRLIPANRSNAIAGVVAGTKNKDRYVDIKLDGCFYKGHNLAWLYMTGEWPNPECDHHDLNPSNNRWLNLREATRSQNCANRKAWGVSGFKGVYKRGKKFIAQINNERIVYLGIRDTPEECAELYAAAAREHFGEFARIE